MEKTSPAEAFPGTGTDEITDPTMNLPTMESTTSHTDLARHNGQLNKMYSSLPHFPLPNPTYTQIPLPRIEPLQSSAFASDQTLDPDNQLIPPSHLTAEAVTPFTTSSRIADVHKTEDFADFKLPSPKQPEVKGSANAVQYSMSSYLQPHHHNYPLLQPGFAKYHGRNHAGPVSSTSTTPEASARVEQSQQMTTPPTPYLGDDELEGSSSSLQNHAKKQAPVKDESLTPEDGLGRSMQDSEADDDGSVVVIDEKCGGEPDGVCTLGSGDHRKVTSHIFGRNKRCTHQISEECWIRYCRKHYQRQKYRCPKDWFETQLSLIDRQLDRMEEWGGVNSWTIALRKKEKGQLDAENAYNAQHGRFPDPPFCKERYLVPYLGPDKTFKEVRELLDLIDDHCTAHDIIELPGFELLPSIDEQTAPRSKNANARRNAKTPGATAAAPGATFRITSPSPDGDSEYAGTTADASGLLIRHPEPKTVSSVPGTTNGQTGKSKPRISNLKDYRNLPEIPPFRGDRASEHTARAAHLAQRQALSANPLPVRNVQSMGILASQPNNDCRQKLAPISPTRATKSIQTSTPIASPRGRQSSDNGALSGPACLSGQRNLNPSPVLRALLANVVSAPTTDFSERSVSGLNPRKRQSPSLVDDGKANSHVERQPKKARVSGVAALGHSSSSEDEDYGED